MVQETLSRRGQKFKSNFHCPGLDEKGNLHTFFSLAFGLFNTNHNHMYSAMNKRLSINDFAVTLELPIQWGDMDALQHVNNARFFRFFESSRVHYLQAIGLKDYFTGSGLSFILAKAGCTFIAPLTFPDTITVGCRTAQIMPSRLEQQYLIHSQKMNATAAIGTASLVAYNYQAMNRAEFPRSLLETLSDFEGLVLESAE